MTIDELSKLSDAELDRLAAEIIRPGAAAYSSSTRSRDVAALLEAKAIEECGWMMYEDFLIDVSVGRDNYNSNYRAHREALHTSNARQRTIAALACLMESEDGKEKGDASNQSMWF